MPAFRALRHGDFRLFFIGTALAQLGFWFSHISYQDLMADITEDELWVSMLFVVTFGPVLLIGPFGGMVVDRLDRKRVLHACYLAIAVTSGAQVALVVADQVTPTRLLITSAAVGATMAVLGPAMGAITANVVPPVDLPSAISLQAMLANVSRIVGPALAAPLLAADLFEVSWGIYFTGAAVALLVVGGVTLRPYERDTENVPVLQRLASGLRHARERRPTMSALGLVAVVSAFGVSHVSLLPAFTADQLGRPKGDFVWLGVATGVGALVGALTAGNMVKRATLLRGAVLIVPYGALLIVFSQVEVFWIAVAVQVPLGFCYISSFTTLQVLVQDLVAEAHRGRVMSLFQIAWAGFVPIGSLVMGLLAGGAGADLGASRAILVTALVCLLWSILVSVRSMSGGSAREGGGPLERSHAEVEPEPHR